MLDDRSVEEYKVREIMIQDIPSGLKRFRRKYGLRQQDLADAAGVTKKTISAWETGAQIPRYRRFVEMARSLDISVDDILEEMHGPEGFVEPGDRQIARLEYYYDRLREERSRVERGEVTEFGIEQCINRLALLTGLSAKEIRLAVEAAIILHEREGEDGGEQISISGDLHRRGGEAPRYQGQDRTGTRHETGTGEAPCKAEAEENA